MKTLFIATAAAALVLPAAAFAQPRDPMQQDQRDAQITARDGRGHATQVQVDGQTYAVCTRDKQDGCINPRDAGLRWGNRELGYWPGQPASEQDGQ